MIIKKISDHVVSPLIFILTKVYDDGLDQNEAVNVSEMFAVEQMISGRDPAGFCSNQPAQRNHHFAVEHCNIGAT